MHFACIRLLHHALPISLLILRKQLTVLQSNLISRGFELMSHLELALELFTGFVQSLE